MNRRIFLGRGVAAGTLFLNRAFRSEPAHAARIASGVRPVAETAAGMVRGVQHERVYAFKGIPYGAATDGKMRFMPPNKVEPWTGIRDAFDVGLRSPQLRENLVPEYAVMERTEPMGENCLCLNVWTPGIKDNRRRPVMLWLHGGQFMAGSGGGTSIYDGTNLASKHDVVLVSVNHRLNIFGFLYLADIGGEQFARARNAGMLDIVLALEWVRDNIENFGGDPGNVTIFGQSGGGAKVSTLMGMPAAKGLFHRAIAMSGAAASGMTRDEATQVAEAVMKKLGLRDVAVLQKVPLLQLLDLTSPGALGVPPRFAPVTDGRSLPAVPFDPVATDISADIPLIIGSTETEVTFFAQQQYDPLDDAALKARLKQALRTEDEGAEKVIDVYKKNRPVASNLDVFLLAASDASPFRTGTDLEALRKAELGKAPVFKYYFQWYSPVRDGMLRCMHTMDIPFVFDNVDLAKTVIGSGSERQPLSDKMSAAWVAFARTGNPNHKGIPQWPAYTPIQRATMVWNNECRVLNDPFREEKDVIASVQGAARRA